MIQQVTAVVAVIISIISFGYAYQISEAELIRQETTKIVELKSAVEQLEQQIERLKSEDHRGPPGPPGKDGRDGRDAVICGKTVLLENVLQPNHFLRQPQNTTDAKVGSRPGITVDRELKWVIRCE